MKNNLWHLVLLLTGLLCACTDYEHSPLQGYIEGEYTQLSSPIAGKLSKLAVVRGEYVSQGQLLFLLDNRPESDQLQRATAQTESSKAQYQDALMGQRSTVIIALIAQRDQAKAALDLAQQNFARSQILFQKGAVSRASFDEATSNLKSAKRRVDEIEANIREAQQGQRQFKIESQYDEYKASQAQLSEAQWRVQQKSVYAPDKGLIFDTFFNEGEQVSAYQAVVSLLSPTNVYVVFYISEPDRSKYKVGDNIMFTCDACHERFPAKINYISPQAEYTPPVIFSRESRAKLVYRVRAAIPVWVTERVYPGQPVDVFLRKPQQVRKNYSVPLLTQQVLRYFKTTSSTKEAHSYGK